MKEKTKLAIKIILKTIFFIFFIFLIITTFFFVKIATSENINFDKEKLIMATQNIKITDMDNNLLPNISCYGKPIVEIDDLKDYTINAFISIEDKQFFSHKGLNFKRILKAFFTNIKNGYAKEGASTISQQTIKNTHLTNEKTLKRKIKEMILTFQLEKSFTKKEILEIYLNVIYFGNGCVGIEQASQAYFNTPSSKLSIAQSATLAGIIKSPNKYCPLTNVDKCKKRRNLVLEEMFKEGYISNNDYKNALKEEIEINQNYKSKINQNLYERLAIQQACKKLNTCEKDLVKSNYTIQTFYDKKMQNIIDDIYANNQNLYRFNDEQVENNIMINDINTGGLLAIKSYGEIDIFSTKRQPASTLKPILIYAPCLEKGIISPDTIIKDEKIDIDGYTPKNSYSGYLGDISSTTALSKSSNTVSVKLLNSLGIENAKNFAKKFGINFTSNDNHLGLALGAMEYGTTLENLSSAYSTFANTGIYTPLIVIKKITDENGKVLFEYTPPIKRIISNETSYLISKMLQATATSGTNKKLSELSPIPASKTGTNGAPKSEKNLDAYNISYNRNFCLNIWCGNTSGDNSKNLNNEYAGGNYNGILAKEIWQKLYENYDIKEDFIKPENIIIAKLDNIEYENNHKLLLASAQTPQRYIKYSLFNKNFAPTQFSQNFTAPDPPYIEHKIIGENLQISFTTLPHLEYTLYKSNDYETIALQTIKQSNDKKVILSIPLDKNISEYYVVSEYKNFEKDEIIRSKKSNVIKIFPDD